MKKLNALLTKAQYSRFYLWLLNRLLWRMIPFNSPHSLHIDAISNEGLIISLPYRKTNLNHIKGIHACALATLCEYTCGLQLMNVLDASAYRIILQKLEVEYLYQAKEGVSASFTFSATQAAALITVPLQTAEAVVHTFGIPVYDRQQKLICRAKVTWQIKPWAKVRTKV